MDLTGNVPDPFGRLTDVGRVPLTHPVADSRFPNRLVQRQGFALRDPPVPGRHPLKRIPISVNPLSQCLYLARRISRLVEMWDKLRGPAMAMSREAVDPLCADIPQEEIASTGAGQSAILPALERLEKAERVLLNTLIGEVYLNDDRDREIIVARIALCNSLKSLCVTNPDVEAFRVLWEQNDGEEWATL